MSLQSTTGIHVRGFVVVALKNAIKLKHFCVWSPSVIFSHCYRSRQVQALVRGVAILESVPDEEKDWHPGSEHQVLDLVHPSL